jgi:predicted anti-sigma-YlaC factor YlaD
MFQCKDVAEEASNYLEGDLPLRKRIGLFLHLVICSCCRNYLQQIRQTINTIATIHPTEEHHTDTKALAEKLRALSDSESR